MPVVVDGVYDVLRTKLRGALAQAKVHSATASNQKQAGAPVTPPPASLPISYDRLLRKAEACVSRRERRFARLAGHLFSPAEMFSSPLFQHGNDSLEDRHAIVDRIRTDAGNFTPRPHEFQIEVIEFWLELSAPYIYGQFWQTNYVEIRARNGWTTPNNGIGALRSGRKDGKSTAIAMCVVLGLFNLPNYSIALFAKVHKQSRIILGMALQLARTHPRVKEFQIPRPSCDKFTVRLSMEDERVVSAHSGNAEVRVSIVCGKGPFFALLRYFSSTQKLGGNSLHGDTGAAIIIHGSVVAVCPARCGLGSGVGAAAMRGRSYGVDGADVVNAKLALLTALHCHRKVALSGQHCLWIQQKAALLHQLWLSRQRRAKQQCDECLDGADAVQLHLQRVAYWLNAARD